jgi:Tetratricopeptide repeat
VADNQRIEDLRRRVQKDPASIAFAQLAEECRRAGRYEEAVEVCRAGLAIHPGYLSARVTLGRALIELNEPDEALHELGIVLKSAPENLAAIRGTAEIHHRRGELAEALAQYRAALALARNDPDLQQTVDELARQVEPLPPPASADGMSFEDISSEFLRIAPPPIVPVAPAADAQAAPPPPIPEAPAEPAPQPVDTAASEETLADVSIPPAPPADEPIVAETIVIEQVVVDPFVTDPVVLEPSVIEPGVVEPGVIEPGVIEPGDVTESLATGDAPAPPPDDSTDQDSAAEASATRTIAALEQWLDAIHVTRAQRSA